MVAVTGRPMSAKSSKARPMCAAPFTLKKLSKILTDWPTFEQDSIDSKIKEEEVAEVQYQLEIAKKSGSSKTVLNVLVVEDNKVNQIVISTMLKKLGFNYDLVDNGTPQKFIMYL